MQITYNTKNLTRVEENLIITLRKLTANSGGWSARIYDADNKEYCGFGHNESGT